ncbi:MAG: hypothetical protein A3D52_00260 [Candidatus Taylorbacteria bacterium RIFCSPHIGHO2_02_FULL_44_36]|uniref:Uncharacterized protein n=1 Tax=Candidatus Taylorbacteria bacterium RIFCSPLOWO2_12_FULL_44_15c TaxID=1802333 RepID=A0A1G2P6Y5_9BACT|nr:MAG: hypothetical protein A3D52_00260 [Candidatus Taylorbacteria bacterium RIFCSPHIGHO2_02_FULL_44_36]OHA38335.1 MAG: hypothetical protein A3I97_02345 [Candidatus Taylorbacteria bacterium RIFCSPLOWO2_02_FULL_44_35]OHA44033.1 MAG: hypothetical protein A3G03_00550 [Candidatus Taylorbacteria bacterium RIFCSPLOWO2_12_FULL_44_15c]
MTPKNTILFFIIFTVIVGGGVWFLVGSKSDSGQNFTENLPPARDPNTKNKSIGSFFSNFFSLNLFPSTTDFFPLPEINTPIGGQSPNSNENISPETNSAFSSFKGKIRLGYDRSTYYGYGDKDAADQEYLSIQTESGITEKIRLTGLTLKSAITGVKVEIGRGVYLYFSGTINSPQDIYLGPGETAYIVTGRSPLGVSLRVNKCLGYLAKNQNFTPYLYSDCPAVRNEPLPKAPNNLNDKCLDYIENFPTCTTFTTGELELSPECNNFLIEKTTYSYCVQAHKNDKGFYQANWRIYLSRDETLWKSKRETIELLDQNGKLIDSVSY